MVGSISGRSVLIQDRYGRVTRHHYDDDDDVIARWSTQRGVEPRVDTSNDLLSMSVTHVNGYTTISFARRKDTNDTVDDLDISNPEGRFFVYGWGGAVNFGTNTISYHPQTPIVSTNRVVIPSSATCTGNINNTIIITSL